MTAAATDAIAVLLVDDVADERQLMQLLLETAGGFVVTGHAGDGIEALEQVAGAAPDLVLLDLSMPRMDGLEALPRLRAAAPDALVVVMSGFSARQQEAQALALGAHAYVEKGTPAAEVLSRLATLLADHGRMPRPPPPPPPPPPAARRPTGPGPRQRAELLRLAQDHAPVGMALVGLDGSWVEPNPALERLLGRTPEQLVALATEQLAAVDDPWMDREGLAGLLAGRVERCVGERRYVHPDGRTIHVELHVSLVRDPDGAPRCFIAQLVDITHRVNRLVDLEIRVAELAATPHP